MVLGGAGSPARVWPVWSGASARVARRHLLRVEDRLPVALLAPKLPQLEDGVLVLPALEPKRGMGSGSGLSSGSSALQTRAPSSSYGGCCRHPKRQDNRKRGRRGYDGAKKIKGRKRVELCDMSGHLLEVVVVPADTDERTCALAVLIKAKKRTWSAKLQTIFADSGFAGQEFEAQVREQLGFVLHIVHRDKEQAGFVPLPKRWLIEQVFGCQGRNRRLCRDYEGKTYIARATIQVVNLHRWLRRLAPAPSSDPPFRYRKQTSISL